MALASALDVGGLLGTHAAVRAALDGFATWLAAGGARDDRPIYELAMLEADWQAADALLWGGERGGARERALAAAAIAQAARHVATSEWLGRAGIPTPWARAMTPFHDEVAAHLGETYRPLAGEPAVAHTYDQFRLLTETALAPLAGAWYRQDRLLPDSILAALAERQVFALAAPASCGGREPWHQVVAVEALAGGCLAAAEAAWRAALTARCLSLAGTAAQQAAWLPELAMGRRLVTVAPVGFEYGEGRLLDAVPAPGGWTLNGRLPGLSFAGRADWLLVAARTDPQRGPLGLSLFLVEKPPGAGHEFRWESPTGGQLVGKAVRTAGGRGLRVFDVTVEDLFLPDDRVIGGAAGQGQGFVRLAKALDESRLLASAQAVGLMQRALHLIGAAAPAADDGLGRQRWSTMLVAAEGARQLTYRTARLAAHGDPAVPAAVAKLYAAQALGRIVQAASQFAGEAGGSEAHPVCRLTLDARAWTLGHGDTTDLALHVVAPALIRAQVA